jgi:hypothetical protein
VGILGVVISIFGFFSPFFFIIPLIFFGIIVRIGVNLFRGLSGRADWTIDGATTPYRLGNPYSARRGTSYQARIFKLAYRFKGRLTLSDIIVDTGLGIDDAERVVEEMVDNVHVRMEVDQEGGVSYEFPEIIRRFES